MSADEECVLFGIESSSDGKHFTCGIHKERRHRDNDAQLYSYVNDFGIHTITENPDDGTVTLYNTYGHEDSDGRKKEFPTHIESIQHGSSFGLFEKAILHQRVKIKKIS